MTQIQGEDRNNSWYFWGRIVTKTTILLTLCNILFTIDGVTERLGSLSLYNTVLTGRDRLPYGEQTADSYNLSLNNIPAMMASHEISVAKPDNEFRVVLLGDSSTWGWLLTNEQTVAQQLNQQALTTADGRNVVFYNLGYPIMSLAKDLLLLDEAIKHEPDMILWLVSLESFALDQQLVHPIVQGNAHRLRPFIDQYQLHIDPQDPQFSAPSFWERTLFGQRRPLADLLRLQSYGVAWSSAGLDQAIPENITLRANDFSAGLSWYRFDEPTPLESTDLAFDVLNAGVSHLENAPIIIINEPIYRGDGENSELHYNSFYPRWVYDQYREMLQAEATKNDWHYHDLWDTISAEEFTDTPLHLTPQGTTQLTAELTAVLQPHLDNETK